MSQDTLAAYIIIPLVLLIFGSFIRRIIKFGGLKAALFGAKIERTIGEVSGSKAMIKTVLKVHSLRAESDKTVALEIVSTSLASYQMLPITLSTSETRKLIDLLETAIGDNTTALNP